LSGDQHRRLSLRLRKQKLKISFVEFTKLGDFKLQDDQSRERAMMFYLVMQHELRGVIHPLNTVAHSNAQHEQTNHQRTWSH